MCQNLTHEPDHVDGNDMCGTEWNGAWLSAKCDQLPRAKQSRQWAVTFGPYYLGERADIDDNGQFIGNYPIVAPAGTVVHPDYQNFCASGKCLPDSTNNDVCGEYCICE
jgi:hypothetical protein